MMEVEPIPSCIADTDAALTVWHQHWRLYTEVKSATKTNATFAAANASKIAAVDSKFDLVHALASDRAMTTVGEAMLAALPPDATPVDAASFQSALVATNMAVGEQSANLSKLMSGHHTLDEVKARLHAYNDVVDFIKQQSTAVIATADDLKDAIDRSNRILRIQVQPEQLAAKCDALDNNFAFDGRAGAKRSELLRSASDAFMTCIDETSLITLFTDDLDTVSSLLLSRSFPVPFS